MITQENWTHCNYKVGDYSVSLSTGGDINKENEYLELFFVNKYYGEDLLHQEAFYSLNSALNSINTNFEHWDFEDKGIVENSSGCSSCQAH